MYIDKEKMQEMIERHDNSLKDRVINEMEAQREQDIKDIQLAKQSILSEDIGTMEIIMFLEDRISIDAEAMVRQLKECTTVGDTQAEYFEDNIRIARNILGMIKERRSALGLYS